MKFICTDCQHEFDGNDFTTECVACNSSKIKTITGGPNIPWKKILAGFGIVLLLIFLTRMCGGDESPLPEQLEYKVTFENKGNSWRVVLKQSRNGQTIDAFPDVIDKIINKGTKRPVNFNFTTGELFPCADDTVESNFVFHFKNPIAIAKPNMILGHLTIDGSVSPNALCPLTAQEDDFIFNTNSNNCDININIKSDSRRTQLEKGGIWISVSGKNGEYKRRTSWNPINEGLKKWDVYIVCNNRMDTVKMAKRNEQSYTCSLPCPSNENLSKQSAISEKFLEVLSNCENRGPLRELSNLLAPIRVDGEIDNVDCDWATLYATIIAGCPNTMYELESPIQLSKSCKSVSIKIKMKQ